MLSYLGVLVYNSNTFSWHTCCNYIDTKFSSFRHCV